MNKFLVIVFSILVLLGTISTTLAGEGLSPGTYRVTFRDFGKEDRCAVLDVEKTSLAYRAMVSCGKMVSYRGRRVTLSGDCKKGCKLMVDQAHAVLKLTRKDRLEGTWVFGGARSRMVIEK